ncbi:bifunctional diaminohydroxyphosphoribosylaminopyrimidine deaminase/5-amino-6-(5-phosphoribosylamino)uracil reductase RibD [Pelagibacteraceae bacterium]|nr:bifunctional diaminohydroxyphosphoribosylaminopyrimidine deaminase/5-amino-6-(5-phosphoribosylamino)uracil reductase RibD [Pelagibacteraceae bacterium]
MELAYRMAIRAVGTTSTNPAVGCVIVKNNNIISRGWTQPGGVPHAEVHALSAVKDKSILKGAEMYCTLEPCSHYGKTDPCVDSIINSRIKKVFIGGIDKNPKVNGKGVQRLEAAKIRVELIQSRSITRLNNIFFNAKIQKKPFVISKIATTYDFNMKSDNSTNRWITNELSRAHGHYLRYKADAMLVGKNTILIDNPDMHCRLEGLNGFSPDIFILDSNLRIPIKKRIFNSKSRKIYIFHKKNINNSKVTLFAINQKKNLLDINEILLKIGEIGIQRILVEGGAKLMSSLSQENLIDTLYWFKACKTIGKKGKNNVTNLRISKSRLIKSLKLENTMQIKSDNLEVYVKK